MKNLCSFLLLLPVLLVTGCSKKDSHPSGGGGGGHLFYAANLAFKVLDLGSGTEKSIINHAQESHLERYDVARDGSEIIFYSESLNSDDITFTIYNPDGTVIKRFQLTKYVSGVPKFSPDKSLIAIIRQPPSVYPDKYVFIVDRNGKALHAFKGAEDYAWTSDGRLLMSTASGFYLTDASLNNATPVGNGSFQDTPVQLDISRDDKQVAFVSGKHIWKMNLDGSNLQQVTSSGVREWFPAWSPDGSRLFFSLDWSGTCLEVRSMPAGGGQVYLDPPGDGPAPRVMAGGQRICSRSQPMVRP